MCKGFFSKLSTVDLFKVPLNVEGAIKLEGENLRRYQTYVLGIAADIIDVCEEQHVAYHLTGGSALGAVRHGGFIPWDDDMDIDILGSDFERFEQAFLAKYGDKYWLHTWKKPGYGILVSRVRLKNSVLRAREDDGNDECGFFVDLIRIENTYNNALLRKLHGVVCMGMGFLLSCRNFYENRKLMMKMVAPSATDTPDIAQLKRDTAKVFRTKIRLGRLTAFRSVDKWVAATQRWYSRCKNNHSTWVTVPAGRRHYFGEMYRRADFVEAAKMPFEGYMWNVPKEYDAYLKNMYGDYMQIPPPEKREEHVILELKFPDEMPGSAANND